jgi:hypothetical protein
MSIQGKSRGKEWIVVLEKMRTGRKREGLKGL